jgi:inward rectifier potassium channel
MDRQRSRRGITLHLGAQEFTRLGASRISFHDAFHTIMSLTWPQFFGGAVLLYLVVNALFACLYFAGDGAISNAHGFSDCFFFSVETLATVGYGVMSPGSFYGHCIATVEIITGLLTMAVITSLVFARFSKPTARMLFSRVAVVTEYDGVPTLMLRVANQRNSYILEAAATAALLRDEETREGHQLTRFFDLRLQREHSPIFALSWLIMHRIDESSPLHGLTSQQLINGDMRLLVTVSGTDETFAATVTARQSYAAEDIIFGRKFADIFLDGEHPRHSYIDMSRFHDLEGGEE